MPDLICIGIILFLVVAMLVSSRDSVENPSMLDDKINVFCLTCCRIIYTSDLTFREARGNLLKSSDFMPLGRQRPIIEGKAAPVCSVCGAMWVGFNESGKWTIHTTSGIISAL